VLIIQTGIHVACAAVASHQFLGGLVDSRLEARLVDLRRFAESFSIV
jgi:hypothetical protein